MIALKLRRKNLQAEVKALTSDLEGQVKIAKDTARDELFNATQRVTKLEDQREEVAHLQVTSYKVTKLQS